MATKNKSAISTTPDPNALPVQGGTIPQTFPAPETAPATGPDMEAGGVPSYLMKVMTPPKSPAEAVPPPASPQPAEVPPMLQNIANTNEAAPPSLAPIGERTSDNNPVFSGPSPAPGQPYKKPSFWDKVGNAIKAVSPGLTQLGSQFGSDRDREFALEQKKLAMQEPLTQAQTEATQAETGLRKAQQSQMETSVPVDLGNGRIAYVPRGQLGAVLGKQIAGEYANQKQGIANQGKRFVPVPNVGVLDTQAPGGPHIVAGSNPTSVTITPEIASDYNMPEQLVGKTVPLTQFASMERGGAMQFGTVMGANGPAIVNKIKGTSRDLGLGNPGVATAAARAKFGAMYDAKLAPEYDEQGNPTGRYRTTNRLQLLQSGEPFVTAPNMITLQGKQALARDIYGALENVRNSGSQIDWGGANRASIAAALADPTTTSGDFMQSVWVKRLSPAERQYVVDVKTAQEVAASMRGILGAGQVSDLQRHLIGATNPGAQTPDFDYLNRQLDAVEGTVDRIYQGLPNVQKPGSTVPNGLKPLTSHSGNGGNTPPPSTERPRPKNVPKDYVYDAHGSKGAGWYKPSAAKK